MGKTEVIKVALVGNPNTGKSSLFNQLTGLNQKVSNYPGITVEKKSGTAKLNDNVTATIIDLPGTYSINPTSLDENIVLESFLNESNDYPDVVVVVADVENLKRNLFLFSQIKDLEIPAILVINMADQMKRKGISLDIAKLKQELRSEVLLISARKNLGIAELRKAILDYKEVKTTTIANIANRVDPDFFKKVKNGFEEMTLYKAWLLITQQHNFPNLDQDLKNRIDKFRDDITKLKKMQNKETILRYQYINEILKKTYSFDNEKATGFRYKLDKILTHKVFGYLIFASILLLIFQSIFDWTSVPQIAILFLLISILEETGYMSRVVFLMDKIMRRFGMSGKSVIPLISGTACAIPAIMAARNISGWKERLVTILVTPFTTCSARLPVYAIIIALVIPNQRFLGIFSLQGFTLMALYLLGFGAAMASGFLLNKTLKVRGKSFFVIEMPNYKLPSVKNVLFTVLEKTKAFVFGAGKIILAISIILWVLASNGPESCKNASEVIKNKNTNLTEKQLNQQLASYKLEHSYIGIAGKAIEPAIKPLGYDWKIGIALISSFAAREVFVSTLATIYSVGDDSNTTTIKERMAAEINQDSGKQRFNLPVGVSLLIFYAFAMQCMSTLAIVKRETNSWKWPIFQLIGMTALAYLASLLTFTILN